MEDVGGVGVVDQNPEPVDRPLGLLPHSLGDPERVHDAVAVPARRDLQDLHRTPSLREMISCTMAGAAAGTAAFPGAEFPPRHRAACPPRPAPRLVGCSLRLLVV